MLNRERVEKIQLNEMTKMSEKNGNPDIGTCKQVIIRSEADPEHHLVRPGGGASKIF